MLQFNYDLTSKKCGFTGIVTVYIYTYIYIYNEEYAIGNYRVCRKIIQPNAKKILVRIRMSKMRTMNMCTYAYIYILIIYMYIIKIIS